MEWIKYHEAEKVFDLRTEHSTYQMQVREYDTLVHLYYGCPVGDSLITDRIVCVDRGFSGNPYEAGKDKTFSLDTLPQEYTAYGNGDYRINGLEVEQADGSDTANLKFESYEITKGKYSLKGLPAMFAKEDEAETLEIVLADRVSGLKAHLLYSVFPHLDVITRAVRLEQTGETPVTVKKAMSMEMDFEYREMDAVHFYGRHNVERQMERTHLGHANWSVGSIRGTSSHHHNPFVILCDRNTEETYGNCYGYALAYSGNFLFETEVDQVGHTRVAMGIHPYHFSWTLEQGESFETPEVIMAYSAEGFGKLSRIYHDAYRSNLIRSKYTEQPRPILVNNWEATYFDFDADKIYHIAEEAKNIGLDMFVLDDGWFGKRDNDWCALGDWEVNEEKIRGGLPALAEKIHGLGLKFGLWVEPEMISEDSDLYREHPDWALKIPGRAMNRSRHQLNLDITRKEVREHIMNQIFKVLDACKADYVKWDMNRSVDNVFSVALPKERQGEVYHRYVLAVYEMMESLVQRYPDLLFESCSGGGGRFEAGMLYYSPQIWCSDNTDAINRTRIQYGTSFFYPVSSMGAHVSAVPNHQTGRVTSLKTRGITAMAGTFGYELNPALLSDEEKEEIREQIKTFKKYEMLINEGTYWRLTSPFEDEVAAWMSVSRTKDRALVSVVRLYAEANAATCYVKLKGLESDAVYIEENTGRQYTGAALMNVGIPLPFAVKEYEAYQFSFIRLDEAKKLYDEIKKVCGNLKLNEADTADSSSDKRIVISIYGGSGSGKTTIAAALQQYFLNDNTACYVLTGDNYPHRIPMRNDEERLNVYNESGEDGLRGYLGTPKEIDFDRINKELSEFKAGKDIIEIKHMGREDGDISYDETDFTGIKVLILEWTHGGSEYLKGVDIPVFLESSPEETKARRIKRGRDENAASPFICRVVELEQEKLDLQGKNARIVVGKDGKVYEQ